MARLPCPVRVRREIGKRDRLAMPNHPVIWYVDKIVTAVAVLFAVYMFYATFFGPYITLLVHWAIFLLVMYFIYYMNLAVEEKKSRISRLLNYVMAGLSVLSIGYILYNYERMLELFGAPYLNFWDIVMGTILVVVVLEAARRENLPFFILGALAIVYVLFGNFIPGILSHPGMEFNRFVFVTAFTDEGIFGLGVNVASSYLFMFMLLAAAMTKTGTGEFIMNLCNAFVGHRVGGPAKTSMFASAGLGTIVGSSIGNVVVTGSYTIPLMKRAGFKPHVAAAVETVVSEGSQLVPPILGTAAFLMAEFIGVPYSKIALATILPAILYYLSIYTVIHIEALRMGLGEIPKEDFADGRQVLRRGWHLLIPPLFLVYLLVVEGYTPSYSGMVTVTLSIVVAMCRKHSRLNLRDIGCVLDEGVRMTAKITALIAAIGLISQAMTTTGLAGRLTDVILAVSNGSVFGTAVVAVAIATVLGMGISTPIAYILMAMFVAPALEAVGIPTLAAHLFLFYFAIKSGSTPPVAIVAVVAASIADANWFKTGMTAFRYSLPGFIVGFMFLYSPPLLLDGTAPQIVLSFLTASVGVVAAAAAVQGWCFGWLTVVERLILFAAAILLVKSGLVTDLFGIALSGGIVLWRVYGKGNDKVSGASAAPDTSAGRHRVL